MIGILTPPFSSQGNMKESRSTLQYFNEFLIQATTATTTLTISKTRSHMGMLRMGQTGNKHSLPTTTTLDKTIWVVFRRDEE